MPTQELPTIDVTALVDGLADRRAVADQIGRACRDDGFFYVTGHGVDEPLQAELERLSRQFFALALEQKLRISMALGGSAWRGYFPPGGELTSGRPDLKEGLYFGAELAADHPKVLAGKTLHGPNLFPLEPAGSRETVLAYLDAMTTLGHALMAGIALSLDLDESYFTRRYTADPLILFRIFNYPVMAGPADPKAWGVGEHTDYGLLTILKQDSNGGLQVKSRTGWIDAPPVARSFVCNIGDMLDRLTGGAYRSALRPARWMSPTRGQLTSCSIRWARCGVSRIAPVSRATSRPSLRAPTRTSVVSPASTSTAPSSASAQRHGTCCVTTSPAPS